jgi:hypothetical protein
MGRTVLGGGIGAELPDLTHPFFSSWSENDVIVEDVADIRGYPYPNTTKRGEMILEIHGGRPLSPESLC